MLASVVLRISHLLISSHHATDTNCTSFRIGVRFRHNHAVSTRRIFAQQPRPPSVCRRQSTCDSVNNTRIQSNYAEQHALKHAMDCENASVERRLAWRSRFDHVMLPHANRHGRQAPTKKNRTQLVLIKHDDSSEFMHTYTHSHARANRSGNDGRGRERAAVAAATKRTGAYLA